MNPYITNECSIDSLKVRIIYEGNEDKVKLYAQELQEGGRFERRDKVTGEVSDEDKRNLSVEYEGIKTFYNIGKVTVNNCISVLCLTIGVHSKMLKERYFEGINNDTIKIAYDYIISQGKVFFPFELMLLSDCTDIDFKYDIETLQIDKISDYLEEHRKVETYEVFRKSDNRGIQFGERSTTKSRSFLKVYDKGVELHKIKKELKNTRSNGSNEFRSAFLHGEVRGIVRFEYNIASKKHANNILKINDCTLQNLLNLNMDIKMNTLKKVIKSYQGKAKMKVLTGREVRDIICVEVVEQLLNYRSEKEVRDYILGRIVNIKQKSVKRIVLDKIFSQLNGVPAEPEDHLQRFFDTYLKR